MNSSKLRRMVSLPIRGWERIVVLIQGLFLSNMSSRPTRYQTTSKRVVESKQRDRKRGRQGNGISTSMTTALWINRKRHLLCINGGSTASPTSSDPINKKRKDGWKWRLCLSRHDYSSLPFLCTKDSGHLGTWEVTHGGNTRSLYYNNPAQAIHARKNTLLNLPGLMEDVLYGATGNTCKTAKSFDTGNCAWAILI